MENSSPNNEKFLINALKQDSQQAFESIYNQNWEKLFSIAYHWTQSSEIAREMVQDLFVRLWEKRHSLEINKSLQGYLVQSMKYIIFNYLDAKRVRDNYAQKQQQNFRGKVALDTQESIDFNELNQVLEQELNTLPERSRLIFNLSRKEDYSNQEIADKLNVSIKTVEYHLTKTLKLLRVQLKDFVVTILLFFNIIL